MTTVENKSGRRGKLKTKITFTHRLSWDDAYTPIYSLGECLDRLEGLDDWRTRDENVEITEEAKREIRIIAALRGMIIAHRFSGSKSA